MTRGCRGRGRGRGRLVMLVLLEACRLAQCGTSTRMVRSGETCGQWSR
jgi:hypothetical protein